MTPEDYFVGGNPVLLIEEYERFKTVHPGVYLWKQGTELALGRECKWETMRRFPAVHHRWLYPTVRKRVEEVHKRPFLEWMLEGQNEFPQTRQDFNLLGAVAHDEFWGHYHWIDLGKEPRPKDKLLQCWSRASIDTPIDTSFAGKITPLEIFKQLEL